MKGREVKLREPPETHDLRKCPELSDFSKKESTVPVQIMRGIGKPKQRGYGFIKQDTSICSDQFLKNGMPFHVTVTHLRFTLQCRKINLN